MTYTVRKNRIEKQYVSQSSTGILSIAVDDLLLDNVSQLLSFDTRSTGIEGGEDLIKKSYGIQEYLFQPVCFYLVLIHRKINSAEY
ncbi:hypothetical protein L950_0226845 [Sphingobacterium sp. IITKGP-BTPF85]|nr:hypothetical protein L950_0226845 [Sphingobacterium sp. IITKGP-BTPF85]